MYASEDNWNHQVFRQWSWETTETEFEGAEARTQDSGPCEGTMIT